jgi:branched-chain amino acid transport system ATP-binding protein
VTALLRTRGLTKRFGGAQVIEGIDFDVEAGEVRCIIGPNGAGKTTFFKLITGELQPTGGDIAFLDEALAGVLPHERIRLGMSIKFQIPGIFPGLTVRQHLQLGLHQAGDERGTTLDALLGQFRLERKADISAGNLSHGHKQWLEIAMAVSLSPRLLLLDEPVAGMSAEETRATGALILELQEQGLTIMVVDHDMTFVKQIASRVTVLHNGRLFADGRLADIVARDDVAEIYLGKKT